MPKIKKYDEKFEQNYQANSPTNEHTEQSNLDINSRPHNFEEYQQLPIASRLAVAQKIYTDAAPTIKRDGGMIENALTFDISHLSSSTNDSVQASVAFAEGSWINEFNTVFITKRPHLKIHVGAPGKRHEHFADLEFIDHYTESSYKNYKFSHKTYNVINSSFDTPLTGIDGISDFDHPLFINTISIVDAGIAEIYGRIDVPSVNDINQ